MSDILHQQPIPSHIEPILAVPDVVAAIHYWQDVLGFSNQWVWNDPVDHGGVSWNGAFVQFTRNAERAKRSEGNVLWCRVKYIDLLYKLHKERNADIVEHLQKRPWGMDEYVVKDINSYYIAFSGNSNERPKSQPFPENISILFRTPTVDEFIALHHSVGWTDSINMEHIHKQLEAPVFSAVAIDTTTNEMIGCALLLSDNASFYYVKDVMVKKEWQNKRIGTALMKALSDWLDQNAVKKAFVGLYTREGLESFYGQFGFSKGFGMFKKI